MIMALDGSLNLTCSYYFNAVNDTSLVALVHDACTVDGDTQREIATCRIEIAVATNVILVNWMMMLW